jgi:Flp pilus assembly pilin Flp
MNPSSPLGLMLALLGVHVRRARSERGASAVEWVIIAAIVVGICVLIAGILRDALQGEAQEIGDEIRNQ